MICAPESVLRCIFWQSHEFVIAEVALQPRHRVAGSSTRLRIDEAGLDRL